MGPSASQKPIQFSAPTALCGGWNGATNRPNVAAGDLTRDEFTESAFELSTSRSPNNRYLNTEMLTAPPALQLGTGAKRYGNVRGFGATSENLTLTKSHRIAERATLQLRGELLNLLNRRVLGGISSDVNNPNFGYATSVSGNRQVQVSARFEF